MLQLTAEKEEGRDPEETGDRGWTDWAMCMSLGFTSGTQSLWLLYPGQDSTTALPPTLSVLDFPSMQ